MRVQIFQNGNEYDTRMIRVEVNSAHITFYFDQDEDDFYWIVSEDWKVHSQGDLDAPQNWRNHMKRKMWFTNKMEEFIDKCLNIQKL